MQLQLIVVARQQSPWYAIIKCILITTTIAVNRTSKAGCVGFLNIYNSTKTTMFPVCYHIMHSYNDANCS